jgi:hypothetical protein
MRWRSSTTWWLLFASQWPGLASAATLAWRLLASCVALLAVAHAGEYFAGLRWKKAEESIVVYRGALVVVVPFLLSPALGAVNPWRIFRRAQFHFKVTRLAVVQGGGCNKLAHSFDSACLN